MTFLSRLSSNIAIAGIDEAGRGPLAGPVTAACVVLPHDIAGLEVADSKRLSPKKREKVFDEIQQRAVAYSVVSIGHHRIEKINIREAARLAMRLSAQRVQSILYEEKKEHRFTGMHCLVDGDMALGPGFSSEAIVQGDQKIAAISAASILAKVTRDRLMLLLESRYPGYGFAQHKGYGTSEHLKQLAHLGPSPVHRRTFRGVKELVVY
jgi:ribonuclease HII